MKQSTQQGVKPETDKSDKSSVREHTCRCSTPVDLVVATGECDSEARVRIDDAVRKVWLAYRYASDVSVDMLTEQDMELWCIVTSHRAIQDRLNATLPNAPGERPGATTNTL